jgi:hypothetical protein
MLHLVDHEHLNADGPHQPQRRLFQVDHARPRTGRCAERRQELSVEPALAGLAAHLQG